MAVEAKDIVKRTDFWIRATHYECHRTSQLMQTISTEPGTRPRVAWPRPHCAARPALFQPLAKWLVQERQRAVAGERRRWRVQLSRWSQFEAVIGGINATSTSGWAAATSFTPAMGICWSFSPKCRSVGTRGFKSLSPMIPPRNSRPRRSSPEAARRRPGDRAAKAEPDHGDLAALASDLDRGGDVTQHLLAVDLAGDRDAARSGVGVVTGLELRLDMLENGRGHGEIAPRPRTGP